MEYPKRIEAILSALRLNQTGLAKELGVSRGIISEFTSGAREPSKDFLFGISKLGISVDWFLSGEGPMFVGKTETVSDLKTDTISVLPDQKDDECAEVNHSGRGVPYYDVDVMAHISTVLESTDAAPDFFVDFRPFNDCTAYLPVYGDSMFPMIQSGEIIAVKRINNLDVLLWGEPYLVVTSADANEMRTVKLVHQHENPGFIILRASNPNFKGDTIVPKEAILALYIVKGKISRRQL